MKKLISIISFLFIGFACVAEPVKSMLGADGSSMVQTDGHDLPDGIVAVEFLESTGTQYINTGIMPANNMSFDCAMMFTELTSSDHTILGSRSSGITRFQMAHTFANKWTVAIGAGYDEKGSVVSTNTFYQLHGEASNGQTLTLFANGSQVATRTGAGISTVPIYVLARNLGATVNAYSNARIYSLKIYVNDGLVRDFIPVRFTNEYGETEGAMYDRVSGELFRNQGTGEFLLGPDVKYK